MKKWYVDPTYQNYAREMKEMGLIPKDWSKHPEYVQLVCDAADYGRQIRDRTFTRKDKIKAFLSERAKEPIKKQPSNDFTLGSYNTRTGKFQPLEKTTNESSISVQESVSGTTDTFTHAHDTQTSIQNTYIAPGEMYPNTPGWPYDYPDVSTSYPVHYEHALSSWSYPSITKESLMDVFIYLSKDYITNLEAYGFLAIIIYLYDGATTKKIKLPQLVSLETIEKVVNTFPEALKLDETKQYVEVNYEKLHEYAKNFKEYLFR